jgi:hypothetical protein
MPHVSHRCIRNDFRCVRTAPHDTTHACEGQRRWQEELTAVENYLDVVAYHWEEREDQHGEAEQRKDLHAA